MAAELFPTIDAPSADARAQATARQNVLTKPAGSLGRLEQLGIWLSACQGVCHVFFVLFTHPSKVTRCLLWRVLVSGCTLGCLGSAMCADAAGF